MLPTSAHLEHASNKASSILAILEAVREELVENKEESRIFAKPMEKISLKLIQGYL